MNKQDYEQGVLKSSLNQTAKLLLLAFAHHCKQQECKEVWPSNVTVAEMAGCSRDTAKKYTEQLVESGWLVKGSLHPGNVQGYTFGSVAEASIGNLGKRQRNMSAASIGNLKQGAVVEPVSTTDLNPVADTKSPVAESNEVQLPILASPVADTVSARKEEKNYLEKKEKSAASPAPSSLPLELDNTVALPLPESAAGTAAFNDVLDIEDEDTLNKIIDEDVWVDLHVDDAGPAVLNEPVSNPASKDTQQTAQAGREPSSGLPEPAVVKVKAEMYARHHHPYEQASFLNAVKTRTPGWSGDLDNLFATVSTELEAASW